MRSILIGIFLCCTLAAGVVSAATPQKAAGAADKTPWWRQGKINFMWGTWARCSNVPADNPSWGAYERPIPKETFRNAAQAGCTVFADLWKYSAEHAVLAHEQGLKYFACSHLAHMNLDGRKWINEQGVEVVKPETKTKTHVCPLDETAYEKWLTGEDRPDLAAAGVVHSEFKEGIRKGIVDGIQIDWESSEAGICYCDYCFGKFLQGRGISDALPEKSKRFDYIKSHNLRKAYEDNYHRQRFEMFTRIRKKLQALNPQLLFSSYGAAISDFTRAMNTPSNPFIFLDCRHYYNDDRQPWWESYGARLRKEGYLYIPGGWTSKLFGAQPSQVSAARWIYEAMVNEDGVWLWFEHRMTDEVYTAYASADRMVKSVEGAVGDFLMNGRRDANYVTAVEWTGNPDLQKAAVCCTYHLGERHLVHLNNVNTEWPLRVRLRFPQVGKGTWTVRDPLGGTYYSRDGKSALWSADQLKAGIVVTLDARSDLFAIVSPSGKDPAKSGARLAYSREFDTFYDHKFAAEKADPIEAVTKKKDFAIYGVDLERLVDSSEKVADLPSGGWTFRMDSQSVGESQRWFASELSADGWIPFEIGDFWGEKGSVGFGWYRRAVEVPPLPADRRIYLHFGAVDEDLRLWIDGEFIGDYSRGAEGWDQPFAMDVTRNLTAGKHHLTFRVFNRANAGGVWKPVSIIASADTTGSTAQSGDLLFTSAEQMLTMPEEWGCGYKVFANNAICALSGEDESKQRLRHLYGHLWSPSYSPDGARIVFVHDAGGRGQINVMNRDGSDAVNLSSNKFCDRSPVWSPDGKRIAFISDRNGDWNLYVMNSDGSGQRMVAGNPGLDCAPVWSPDGKHIAWESHVSGIPTIWVCDADGKNSRPLIAPDRPFSVRQPSKGSDGVFAFPEVGWPFGDNTVYLTDPAWSPDGKKIAARGLGAYTGASLCVIDSDGSSMSQVIGWIGGIDDLVWSPDGSMLAGTFRTAPQETDRSGILVVKADGTSDPRYIVDVTPRGTRLTSAVRPGIPTWYSQGSAEPRRVVKSFSSVSWSPDGKTLAFSSDMDSSGAFYVYTVPVDGGQPTKLNSTQSPWPNEISWR